MVRTAICDYFGIDVPILLAGMGGVAMSELVAAVSNAGGLGVLGAAMCDAETLRGEIRRTRELTSRPFAVDLLAPDPGAIRPHIEVLYDEKVEIFVAGLAVPSAFIDEMHAHGMKVVVMCGKVRHAVKAEAAGADVVVAQGTEAGGHTGEIGGMALVPQIVDAVSVPVLAAGGIADGRGVAAALALGAQGVVVGSRFIASLEATAAPAYRATLVAGHEDDTVRTRCYTGKPCRTMRNEYNAAWAGREAEIKPFPFQAQDSARKGLMDYMGRRSDADPARTFMPAGQGIGLIGEIKPAARIVRDLVEETATALAALAALDRPAARKENA